MDESPASAPSSASSTGLRLALGFAIIPLNLYVWSRTYDADRHPIGGLQILFVVLAMTQLGLGTSAGITGWSSWRATKRESALGMACLGWFVAVCALIGWFFGVWVPPYGSLHL